MSDEMSGVQQTKIIADLFRISSSSFGQAVHVKSNLIGATRFRLMYMASTSRFQKTDTVPFAVTKTSFIGVDFFGDIHYQILTGTGYTVSWSDLLDSIKFKAII